MAGLLTRRATRAEAFEAEVLPHLDALHRTAVRLTKDRTRGEDLVQDAMLKAFRFFDSFKPGTNFKAWIFRVLYTTFVSTVREKTPAASDLAGAAEPAVLTDPGAEDLDRASVEERGRAVLDAVDDRVKAAVDALPDELRTTFMLSTVEDLKYREVADVMDVPLGTVMSRLFRARKMLQERLLAYAREAGFRAAGEVAS